MKSGRKTNKISFKIIKPSKVNKSRITGHKLLSILGIISLIVLQLTISSGGVGKSKPSIFEEINAPNYYYYIIWVFVLIISIVALFKMISWDSKDKLIFKKE